MMDKERIKELSDYIFNLVQTHSGGMKLTELIAGLDLCAGTDADICVKLNVTVQDVTVQAVWDAIEAHPKLATLVYGWDMGDGDGDASGKDNTGGLIREKIFVYTPLPNSPPITTIEVREAKRDVLCRVRSGLIRDFSRKTPEQVVDDLLAELDAS